MKKYIEQLKKIIRETLDEFAPFTIYNPVAHKNHYSWKWADAMEWLACYDCEEWGPTYIFNPFNRILAAKGI